MDDAAVLRRLAPPAAAPRPRRAAPARSRCSASAAGATTSSLTVEWPPLGRADHQQQLVVARREAVAPGDRLALALEQAQRRPEAGRLLDADRDGVAHARRKRIALRSYRTALGFHPLVRRRQGRRKLPLRAWPSTATRREQMRKIMLMSVAALAVAAVVAGGALAGSGGVTGPAIYVDGQLYRTVGTPTDFSHTGAPDSSFDTIYDFGGLQPNVATAAPGRPGLQRRPLARARPVVLRLRRRRRGGRRERQRRPRQRVRGRRRAGLRTRRPTSASSRASSARSSPCRGTDADALRGPALVAPAPVAHTASWPSPAETVLVVDDEATIREVVVRYLEREGYRTLQAADGEQAKAIVESDPPSLVVLDLMLPGTDGLARLPLDPLALRGAGDHADRARGGGRPDRRSRARRRRLRDEAVLAARARRPRALGAAAGRARPRCRSSGSSSAT